MMLHPLLLTLGLLVAAAPAPPTASRCTHETLNVTGTAVTIGYCVTGAPRPNAGAEVLVPVEATYSAPAGTFRRTTDYRFIAGEASSRIVQNLALDRLGLPGKTLHLTLVYSGGLVRIEGALLTPGAIAVK